MNPTKQTFHGTAWRRPHLFNRAIVIVLGAILALCTLVPNAYGLGATGHRVVGQIAEGHLSPQAALAVKDLLGSESLAIVSTWADEIRSDPSCCSGASPWHYVSIEDGETYESSTKNPQGDILFAIRRNEDILRKSEFNKKEKEEALRWLVHLVGDVHQPLHVGRKADRGGNTIDAVWFDEKTNLHAIWDSKMIDSTKLSFSELAASIDIESKEKVMELQDSNALDWVNESFGLRKEIYGDGPPAKDGSGRYIRSSYKYSYDNLPLIKRRMAEAGVRLAGLFNDIFEDYGNTPNTDLTVDSFSEVQKVAFDLGKLYGTDKVLLVFDIDNTLLSMRQDLGSDQWFAWQEVLPATDPQRVGDFPELLRIQGLLFAISSMRPTHLGQSENVKQLQEAHFTTLLLTSRGFDFRDATRRELLANGYDFRLSTLSPQAGYAGPYCPYDVSQIERSGISQKEAERWLAVRDSNPVEIKNPRSVSYSEGVYMTAGQNKGVMLRMLLHKSGNVGRFKAIVFVDDRPKHTESVRKAFANQKDVEVVVTFRFSSEDVSVRRFEENRNDEKGRVTEAWRRLQKSMEEATHSTLNSPPPPAPKCVPAGTR